jgi:HemY protein
MKRLAIISLCCVLFAGWLGTLVARDPGYVLIAYQDYRFQTSLWIMVSLVWVTAVALYYLFRLLRLVLVSQSSLRDWRAGRKAKRAHELTHKGMALLASGEYSRAEKYLLSGADQTDQPGIYYLAAAKAAEAQQHSEQRETLFRKAVEVDDKLSTAASVSAAEMAATRGDWQRCLDSLRNVKANDLVLRLQKRALCELEDWQALVDLLPVLRSAGLVSFEFEKTLALHRLAAKNLDDDRRTRLYKKLGDRVRVDPEVVMCFVQSMIDERTAEVNLRRAIKKDWQPQYIQAYAALGSMTLTTRIKQAEFWLKKHDDAAVNFALATMYEKAGEHGKARAACQKSIDQTPSQRSVAMMANYLANDGEYAASNDYLKQAMTLVN